MPVLDHLFSIGWIRKALWKLWYPLLTRRLHGEEVLFLNYAYEEEPPMGIPLSPEDEINRAGIQLYHHVATQAPLRGKDLLEVSCGHGGGAAYLTRALQPQRCTALDLNPAGIRFCKQRHQLAGLVFIQGDAENLPFAPSTFDGVVNVEASHCYPNFPRFLEEVARVLRPGGPFLYADFRFADRLAQWELALVEAPLQILRTQKHQRRSAAWNEPKLPALAGPSRALGHDFAGTKGSRIYKALHSGELSYRSYCFEKPLISSAHRSVTRRYDVRQD